VNQVYLTGRVTRDCYVNTLQSGSTIINVSVAVEDQYKKRDATIAKKVHFIDCVRWTQHPENYAGILVKGAAVLVIGSLQQDSWEDKQTKAKRSAVKVKVDQVLPVNTGKVASQPEFPGAVGNEPSPEPKGWQAADDENMPF
jgi:single-strand DNA-binding protein